MNNYLFFRTDRIGDFLVSAILLKAIKRNDKKAHISVVASSKNYFFINTLDFIDEVFLYPDNFLKKIFFFIKLRKKKIWANMCARWKKKINLFFFFFKIKSQNFNDHKKNIQKTIEIFFFKDLFV